MSSEDDGVDDATSALTGMTGWTSANGGGAGGVSELGEESGNFPMAHSKGYKLATYMETGEEDEEMTEAASEMIESKLSALSFDLNGSIETSIEEISVPRTSSYNKSKSRKHHQQAGNGRAPLTAIHPAKAVQFRSPSNASSKSNGNSYAGGAPPISPTSSMTSNISNASKKRAPVPPLRDPKMDDSEEDQMWEEDCNYDINPTLMFLILESRDWKETIALLDGKGLENKNDAWNLGQLFGGKRKDVENTTSQLTKKRKNELRAQARTWIVRRERNGVLRWRMLPLHASLAFNAPFDVVLRLYHLYPGAVRCRNDQGMLPLHHCFKYGNEDKVLELLLDVFPEALTVLDDKARLPMACTPKDGSENERRSNIMRLFSNFQVEMARNEIAAADAPGAGGGDSQMNVVPATTDTIVLKETQPLPSVQQPLSPTPMSPTGSGTLGATPRYTTSMDYNPVSFHSIKPPPAAATATPSKVQVEVEQDPKNEAPPAALLSPKEDSISDRYAMPSLEDSENNPSVGNNNERNMGLSTILEEGDNGVLSPIKAQNTNALKLELLALGENKKKKKGLRKLFSKKRMAQI